MGLPPPKGQQTGPERPREAEGTECRAAPGPAISHQQTPQSPGRLRIPHGNRAPEPQGLRGRKSSSPRLAWLLRTQARCTPGAIPDRPSREAQVSSGKRKQRLRPSGLQPGAEARRPDAQSTQPTATQPTADLTPPGGARSGPLLSRSLHYLPASRSRSAQGRCPGEGGPQEVLRSTPARACTHRGPGTRELRTLASATQGTSPRRSHCCPVRLGRTHKPAVGRAHPSGLFSGQPRPSPLLRARARPW